MKNNYAVLEKEYLDTISRLSEITGWPAEQAESVVGLVVQAAEKKANAVAERNFQDLKNAKYLATKKLLQNYRRLREAINLGTEHALKLLKDTEYQRLMQAEESLQNQKVLSVTLIAAANRVLWARVICPQIPLKAAQGTVCLQSLPRKSIQCSRTIVFIRPVITPSAT